MKMMKRLLLALVLVLVCCTLAACQKDAAVTEATDPTEAPATTETEATDDAAVETAAADDAAAEAATSPDDVMATVGDKVITRAEYDSYLTSLCEYYSSYGYDVTDPSLLPIIEQYAMMTAVEYAVMDLKLVELNLTLTDAEKQAAEETAKADWEAVIYDGMVYYGLTDESTEEEYNTLLLSVLSELEAMGYTEESYIADAVTYAGYDKIFAYATQDVTVTDEDVVAYYNQLVEADKELYANDAASYEDMQYMNTLYAYYGMSDYVTNIYYKPEGYRLVIHVLLEADETLLATWADLQATYEEQQLTLEEGGEVTDTLITAEEVENARLAVIANVQPVIDEMNQKMTDGATFAELIPEYTIDTGMADAESVALGYEVHMDSTSWVIAFRDQCFTVDNIGDITEPVVTDYGVHIIQYVADVPGGPMELTQEMHDSFKTALLSSAQKEAYYAAIDQWVADANVVYSEEASVIMGLTETETAE